MSKFGCVTLYYCCFWLLRLIVALPGLLIICNYCSFKCAWSTIQFRDMDLCLQILLGTFVVLVWSVMGRVQCALRVPVTWHATHPTSVNASKMRWLFFFNEPDQDKTTCAPSEDSDKPENFPSLISLCCALKR